MNKIEQMKNRMWTYYSDACIPRASKLALISEFFLINEKSLESYNYSDESGQEIFFEHLVDAGWHQQIDRVTQLICISKADVCISLGLGGQVIVQFPLLSSIGALKKIYQSTLEDMYSVLTEGQCLVATGYHPKTRVESLSIMPSDTAQWLDDYYRTHGGSSLELLKGTASTRVLVSFTDEDDFKMKYRVASFLSTIFSKVSDGLAIFEGLVVEGENRRIAIYTDGDPIRVKYPVESFDRTFDFNSYIDYLMDVPPVILKVGGNYYYTNDKPLRELLEFYDVSQIDIAHLSQMVYTDVRLDQQIELRMMDAIPAPYIFAIVALVKGIFYVQDNLERFHKIALRYTLEDTIEINKCLQSELDFTHGDMSMNWIMMKVFLDAKMRLDRDEQDAIDLLFEQLNVEGSYSRKLKRLLDSSVDSYLQAIKVL